MDFPSDWVIPDWPAPSCVHAFTTSRNGGVSQGVYGGASGQGGMNPGIFGEDDPACLAANRALLREFLPAEPRWMKQVHGTHVIDASVCAEGIPEADAAYTLAPNVVCVVRTADCLPVLFTNKTGDVVAVAHAGWRGLVAGVLERTVEQLQRQLGMIDFQNIKVPGQDNVLFDPSLMAYLGPAIGPSVFEVGAEVRAAFCEKDAGAIDCFKSNGHEGKYLADLYGLARQCLSSLGVEVFGQVNCTFSQPERFFSYRRSHPMGHMATLIWRT